MTVQELYDLAKENDWLESEITARICVEYKRYPCNCGDYGIGRYKPEDKNYKIIVID